MTITSSAMMITDQADENAEHQVRPAPGREVEIQDKAVLRDQVVVVVDQRDDALYHVEDPDQDQHHAAEYDPRSPAGRILVHLRLPPLRSLGHLAPPADVRGGRLVDPVPR